MSNNLSVTYVGQCSAGHNLKPCQRLLKIYFIEHCSSVNVDIEKVFQHLMVPHFFPPIRLESIRNALTMTWTKNLP